MPVFDSSESLELYIPKHSSAKINGLIKDQKRLRGCLYDCLKVKDKSIEPASISRSSNETATMRLQLLRRKSAYQVSQQKSRFSEEGERVRTEGREGRDR